MEVPLATVYLTDAPCTGTPAKVEADTFTFTESPKDSSLPSDSGSAVTSNVGRLYSSTRTVLSARHLPS